MEILLLCVLALHSICQPYIKRAHNIIDTLLLTDLAIINAISFINYYRVINYGERKYKRNNVSAAIQLVLVYLPVVILTVYILIMLCNSYLHPSQKQTSSSDGSPTSTSSRSKLQKLRSIVSSSGDIHSYDEEELPHRLIAPDSEYRCFEDSDKTLSTPRETVFNPTY